MPSISAKPEKEFRVGAVRAAIWVNERVSPDGRMFNSHKVVIERTYKDTEGFKSTDSLDVNDIPKAILALKRAYEWIMCSGQEIETATAQATVKFPPPRRTP